MSHDVPLPPLGLCPPDIQLTCIPSLPQFGAGWYGHHRASRAGKLSGALWWRDLMHLVHVLHVLKQPGGPPLRHDPDVADAEG